MNQDEWLQPGPRDHVVTRALAELLTGVDSSLVDRTPLDAAEGPRRLARHLARVIERELAALGEDRDVASRQSERINALLEATSDEGIVIPPEVWTGLRAAPTRHWNEYAPLQRGLPSRAKSGSNRTGSCSQVVSRMSPAVSRP